jgi:hypothetical protein
MLRYVMMGSKAASQRIFQNVGPKLSYCLVVGPPYFENAPAERFYLARSAWQDAMCQELMS